jgi:DNA end-binding protein Ku
MEIIQFVKLDEVDPLYFDTSYFCIAEDPGERAYARLLPGDDRFRLCGDRLR